MRAGPLRHRVVIQSPTDAQSDSGEVTRTYAEFARRWSSIEPLNGREFLQAQQARVESTVRIRFRYFAALTTEHRITYEDVRAGVTRTFEVNDVQHIGERKAETHAMCREAH